MFDALVKVGHYEAALAELAKPEFADKEIYLHDYDSECYRSQKRYTLNGLHWGYPDSVCASVIGVNPESNLTGAHYAAFVTGNKEHDRRYSENSRFIKVKYSEAKDIIELGIRQKLDSAKEQVKKGEYDAWMKIVQERYSAYIPASIRIEYRDDIFTIIALSPNRFNTYGFGSFLKNIKAGEVSMSKAAFEALKECSYCSGLMGIDIHSEPLMISYGFAGPRLDVPFDDVSVMAGAWDSLAPLVLIKD